MRNAEQLESEREKKRKRDHALRDEALAKMRAEYEASLRNPPTNRTPRPTKAQADAVIARWRREMGETIEPIQPLRNERASQEAAARRAAEGQAALVRAREEAVRAIAAAQQVREAKAAQKAAKAVARQEQREGLRKYLKTLVPDRRVKREKLQQKALREREEFRQLRENVATKVRNAAAKAGDIVYMPVKPYVEGAHAVGKAMDRAQERAVKRGKIVARHTTRALQKTAQKIDDKVSQLTKSHKRKDEITEPPPLPSKDEHERIVSAAVDAVYDKHERLLPRDKIPEIFHEEIAQTEKDEVPGRVIGTVRNRAGAVDHGARLRHDLGPIEDRVYQEREAPPAPEEEQPRRSLSGFGGKLPPMFGNHATTEEREQQRKERMDTEITKMWEEDRPWKGAVKERAREILTGEVRRRRQADAKFLGSREGTWKGAAKGTWNDLKKIGRDIREERQATEEKTGKSIKELRRQDFKNWWSRKFGRQNKGTEGTAKPLEQTILPSRARSSEAPLAPVQDPQQVPVEAEPSEEQHTNGVNKFVGEADRAIANPSILRAQEARDRMDGSPAMIHDQDEQRHREARQVLQREERIRRRDAEARDLSGGRPENLDEIQRNDPNTLPEGRRKGRALAGETVEESAIKETGESQRPEMLPEQNFDPRPVEESATEIQAQTKQSESELIERIIEKAKNRAPIGLLKRILTGQWGGITASTGSFEVARESVLGPLYEWAGPGEENVERQNAVRQLIGEYNGWTLRRLVRDDPRRLLERLEKILEEYRKR